MRKDYILLDDDLEIMVFPHKPTDPQWMTYDEVDKLERTLSPRITMMIHVYNEMASWIQRHKHALEGEIGE
jgi:hypothetical protein